MLGAFNKIVNKSRPAVAKQLGFPKYLKQFVDFSQQDSHQLLNVDRGTVVPFLQFLRNSDRPAWQRLQAVEALQYFSETILQQKMS